MMLCQYTTNQDEFRWLGKKAQIFRCRKCFPMELSALPIHHGMLQLCLKKDNSTRFVCEFRGVNEVAKKDTYPISHIKDVIDTMVGSKYWSTLDVASAYWCFPSSESYKEKQPLRFLMENLNLMLCHLASQTPVLPTSA